VLGSLNSKEIDHIEKKLKIDIFFNKFVLREYNYNKSRMPVFSLYQLLHSKIVLMCILLKKDYEKVPVLLPIRSQTVPIRSLLRLYKTLLNCIRR